VLKGAQAVALPHPVFSLTLEHEAGPEGGELRVFPEEASDILSGLLGKLKALTRGAVPPGGRLKLESDIPIGAGLGSSAALCVAVARWVQSWSPEVPGDPFELARSLEHAFHGKSSGMDVAVILAGEPVAFRMEDGARPLRIRNIPEFTFHDTGVRAMTRDCVARVQAFRAENPVSGAELDHRMSASSALALEALQDYDRGEVRRGLKGLTDAMNQAHGCFLDWGLVPDQASEIIQDLRARGALSCKLTGAGGGGMVVALWK